MSVSTQFYIDQAAKCGNDAAGAALANQRETLLRAQSAWQAMADKGIKTDAERAKREPARVSED